MNNINKLVLFLIVILACLCLVVAGWLFYSGDGDLSFSPTLPGNAPSVQILSPGDGFQLQSGDVLVLSVRAESESSLAGIELSIDDHLTQSHTFVEQGATSAQHTFLVSTGQTGWHKAVVTAQDGSGNTSLPSVIRYFVAAGPNVFGNPGAGNSSEDPSGEPPAGENGGQAGLPPAGGENPGAAQPENPPEPIPEGEIPQQPADAAPQVTQFDVSVEIVGAGGPAASVRVSGTSQDDSGLEAMIFRWHQQGAQNNGETIEPCDNQLECSREFSMPLPAGEWFFSLQAVDLAGQRSQVSIDLVEIVAGQEDLPPAGVDHDFGPAWLDDVINNTPDLSGRQFLPIGERINVIDLLGWLAEEETPEEAECAEQDWPCLYGQGITVTVIPQPEGNLITLRVDDQFEAPAGKVIVPYLHKTFQFHNVTTLVFPPDWVAGQGAVLQPGATFRWLDTSLVCGEGYAYVVGLNAYNPGEAEAYLAGTGYPAGNTLAYEQVVATSQFCPPGAVGAIQASTRAVPPGATINWLLPANNNWPAEGVGVILLRWNRSGEPGNQQDTVNLFEQQISQATLLDGESFEFNDLNLRCGNDYVYLIGVYPAGQRPGFAPEGWLAHTSLQAPRNFCPEGSLSQIRLNLSHRWGEWVQGAYPEVVIDFAVPQGFAWPNGQDVQLTLWQGSLNESGEYVSTSVGYFPYRPGQNNDFRRQITQAVACSQNGYDFHLTLESDGVILNQGPDFHIDLPPCPPRDLPALRTLTATNDCGGAERCIIINWAPYQPAAIAGYEAPVRMLIERRSNVNNLGWVAIPVPFDSTSYLDSNVGCGVNYLYRMVVEDARGLRSTSSAFTNPPMLEINTPSCDQSWSVTVGQESE